MSGLLPKPRHAPDAAPVPGTDALRDGDQREFARMLKTLLGNLDGMVYRCLDDAEWTMEFVSEGCERLTGYQPQDLLFNQRVSYESITHPEDRERVRSGIHAALAAQRRFDIEYRLIHADGSIRWVWERGVGLYDRHRRLLAIEGIVQDVTARVQALHALRAAERRYHGLFENAIEGIFRSTPEGQYLDANPALARIYGFDSPPELIAGLRDIRAQLYVDPGRREEFIRRVRARGSVVGFESQVFRRDGSVIWISENARAVCGEDGALSHYEGTVEDITERKRYEARIEQQANYDELTGLANRSLLRQRLEQGILATAGGPGCLAVVFVDLDRFKYINDSLGHQAGDDLLVAMAGRLRSCVSERDTVARLGGDEFVIVIAGAHSLADVQARAGRVFEVLSAPWNSRFGEFHVTSSVGVAIFPDNGRDSETLLKNADAAMYRAKECGRNTLQFFTPQLSAELAERIQTERRLRRAVENGDFVVHYQPRLDVATGRVNGAEALVRWQPPGEAMVMPSRFIPLAEETGLIVPIGRLVLEHACRQARRWRDRGLGPLLVSVNVSPRQLRQPDFLDVVAEILRETALAPGQLELEITEGMVMHDVPRMVDTLGQLQRLGVEIAIDDFGTGYSSLAYLKRFPVHRLKVDRSFVADVTHDADDAAIVRTIVALGHNLGLRVVAEGVETAAQIEFLRGLGCDEMQGYLCGRPMPPGELESLLEAALAPAGHSTKRSSSGK
ncbi:MAG: EAL domain-containing protein [Steroidobacteraceae bacterium]|jgi:diguanylate cyclase (GGDEF)-like protein/PAS domain S-box-containing protein|nr:EAL domain-containing protein [Steroidobacteraceae bacterium]